MHRTRRSLSGLCLACLFQACTSSGPVPSHDQTTGAIPDDTSAIYRASPTDSAPPKPSGKSLTTKPLSPYSTEGMLALNQFRTHNPDLNQFLIRNRKPDYFFSGTNSEFAYQKIFLVYLESDNLYLFDPTLETPYKKFHPLPGGVKESMKNAIPHKEVVRANIAPNSTTQKPDTFAAPTSRQPNTHALSFKHPIEKTLGHSPDGPLLSSEFLTNIPLGNSALYPDLYYLDTSIMDLVENHYSIKHEKAKKILKIIFPQAYSDKTLYGNQQIETRKIIVSKTKSGEPKISLIVPDFLPGSDFYEGLHGRMKRAFSSLYQLDLPGDFTDPQHIRFRFELKICQADNIDQCKTLSSGQQQIRAIVIAATIYDASTRLPIETFQMK